MNNLSGPVRFLFRSSDNEVEINLEGDVNFISEVVNDLGLQNSGWLLPIAIKSRIYSSSQSGNEGPEIPEPDPSRIPIIRRSIGDVDITDRLVNLGLLPATTPNPDQLRGMLEELEEPLPVQGPLVVDPMAEAWLKELLRIAVQQFGATSLSTETLEMAASDYLGDRQDLELELWLESLFRMGKLTKIHGGEGDSWGPSPRWLNA